MVKGIDIFQEYFKEYTDQYVLIGGAACSISFEEQDASFRATKDLDMVLIVEALTPAFGERFWQFIRDGGYQKTKSHMTKVQTIIGIVSLVLIFAVLYFIAKFYSLL